MIVLIIILLLWARSKDRECRCEHAPVHEFRRPAKAEEMPWSVSFMLISFIVFALLMSMISLA